MKYQLNPYAMLAARLGISDHESLIQRMVAWHDTMVTHERAARFDHCSEDCAHATARELWAEAEKLFGRGAKELTFLRSRAQQRQAA